ncbi:transposase [Novosphingobium naphthalenivorans]|uniref:transposase n=1 Tax=Novosphingobium naphthalenivorans TaxID=273168 RepID=UPI0009FF7CD4
MFRALLLSIWYDLFDMKLAEALDNRASFRSFCGFSANEATPERGLSVILCARSYRWNGKDHRYGDRQGVTGSVAVRA